MSTNCEHCGYKDNEVKSGSAISDKGRRIILKVEDRDDLSRDILKVRFSLSFPGHRTDMIFLQSETCGLQVPEIDLVLNPGTLGGRFTTVEGILEQVYEELSEKVFTDSIDKGDTAFVDFLTKLKKVLHPTILLSCDAPDALGYQGQSRRNDFHSDTRRSSGKFLLAELVCSRSRP